ncbi:hypothetical protein [Petropleomorpha daqingensis]|uniref:Uncharacterized protein n=1 Tax=Petropleomorpha daqingensis TaxID=2026353 RepID=A0A853CFE5_9ACTN|nr:hypothetical protein [Petropleomorpha daqingensis]NYJ05871.1 hypothetical protein [Petropleomorpha daqingensis]
MTDAESAEGTGASPISRAWLRRLLLLAALCAAVWGVLVLLGGGARAAEIPVAGTTAGDATDSSGDPSLSAEPGAWGTDDGTSSLPADAPPVHEVPDADTPTTDPSSWDDADVPPADPPADDATTPPPVVDPLPVVEPAPEPAPVVEPAPEPAPVVETAPDPAPPIVESAPDPAPPVVEAVDTSTVALSDDSTPTADAPVTEAAATEVVPADVPDPATITPAPVEPVAEPLVGCVAVAVPLPEAVVLEPARTLTVAVTASTVPAAPAAPHLSGGPAPAPPLGGSPYSQPPLPPLPVSPSSGGGAACGGTAGPGGAQNDPAALGLLAALPGSSDLFFSDERSARLAAWSRGLVVVRAEEPSASPD